MGGSLEEILRRRGFARVAGVDEAGRGALAGPLVAAAVVLPPGWVPDGLDDSKRLGPEQREHLHDLILARAPAVAVARVLTGRLDHVGLQEANLAALRAAAAGLAPPPDYLLADGYSVTLAGCPSLRVVKGDLVSPSVAAASVIAKVARDRAMVHLAGRHPGYGWESNKGYASPAHLEALDRLGPSPLHRRCFAPVRACL